MFVCAHKQDIMQENRDRHKLQISRVAKAERGRPSSQAILFFRTFYFLKLKADAQKYMDQ